MANYVNTGIQGTLSQKVCGSVSENIHFRITGGLLRIQTPRPWPQPSSKLLALEPELGSLIGPQAFLCLFWSTVVTLYL